MSVTIRIPSQLRKITGGESSIEGIEGVLRDVITDLDTRYAGLGAKLLDESGELRRFVNIYLNEEDVRFLQGLSTKVESGSALAIIPAVAGG